MKSSILRAGVALACALGLAACGGGDGDLYLSGAVYNVTKDGLVLKNGGDTVAVTASYGSFQFGNRVSTDDQFDIQVQSIPSNNESCQVNNGKARANYYTIAQISVTCTIKTHPLVVAINGLTSTGLVILNGNDSRNIDPNTPSVTMTPVLEDGAYGVTILKQPASQVCTVSGGDSGKGAGTVVSTGVKVPVVVNCA